MVGFSKLEGVLRRSVMSKAKWFAVRKPSTGEVIATSANQIVPPKFRGPTKMLTDSAAIAKFRNNYVRTR